MEPLTSTYFRTVRRIHPMRFLKSKSNIDENTFMAAVSLLQLYPKKTELHKDTRAIELARDYVAFIEKVINKESKSLNTTELGILQSYIDKVKNPHTFWNMPFIFYFYTMQDKYHWRTLIRTQYPSRKLSSNTLNMDIMAAMAYQQRLYLNDLCRILPMGNLHIDWNLVDTLCNCDYTTKQQILKDRPFFQEFNLRDGTTSRMVTVFKDSKKKEFILAFRGTNTSIWNDLTTDIGILAGTIYKYPRYEMAASMILQLCNIPEYREYKISTCGHSLGGSLAMFAFLFIPDDRRGSCIGFNPGVGLKVTAAAYSIYHAIKEKLFAQTATDIATVQIEGNFSFNFIKSCSKSHSTECKIDRERAQHCICKSLPCPSFDDLQKRIKEIYVVRHACDLVSLGWKDNTDVNIVDVGRIPKLSPYFSLPYDVHSLSTSLNVYHQMSCFLLPYIKDTIEFTQGHFPITDHVASTKDYVLDSKCKEFRSISNVTVYKKTAQVLFNFTKKCQSIWNKGFGLSNIISNLIEKVGPDVSHAKPYDYEFSESKQSSKSTPRVNALKSSENLMTSVPSKLTNSQAPSQKFKYARQTLDGLLCSLSHARMNDPFNTNISRRTKVKKFDMI